MEKFEQCPRCESKKVEERGKSYYFLGGWLMFSFCFLLGFLFMPFWLGAALGLGMMIMAPFATKKMHCKECEYSWEVEKKKKQ